MTPSFCPHTHLSILAFFFLPLAAHTHYMPGRLEGRWEQVEEAAHTGRNFSLPLISSVSALSPSPLSSSSFPFIPSLPLSLPSSSSLPPLPLLFFPISSLPVMGAFSPPPSLPLPLVVLPCACLGGTQDSGPFGDLPALPFPAYPLLLFSYFLLLLGILHFVLCFISLEEEEEGFYAGAFSSLHPLTPSLLYPSGFWGRKLPLPPLGKLIVLSSFLFSSSNISFSSGRGRRKEGEEEKPCPFRGSGARLTLST